jgi:hypothetical protein
MVQKLPAGQLVEHLIYRQDGLHAFYVTANDNAASLLTPKTKMASEKISEAGLLQKSVLISQDRRPARLLSVPGSPVVSNGGGGGN